MSDPVGPVTAAASTGLARVEALPPRGMLLLRGELAELGPRMAEAAGLSLPDQGRGSFDGDTALLWMSPDEALLLCPRADAAGRREALREALSGTHHLVEDISDARAMFRLSRGPVREVLARLTPADLRPTALTPGQVRRTRLAQVPAAFWLHDDETAEVICFRSVAQYVMDLLSNAAGPSEALGLFQPR